MDRLTGDFKGVSMFATAAEARIYNRLRQYEDTGLTPEEIAALPDLLDEVERLTAALAAMNKEVGEWRDLAISTADKWVNKIIESFDYSKRVRRARRQRDEWRERAEAAERDLDRYGQCGACKNDYRKNGCGANDYSWCDGGFKRRGATENGGAE